MSTVLSLARDFIERLSNPVYGQAVNEDYGMRLAALLRDEEFARQLNEEVAQLDDPSAFTSFGWLWLMGWARSKNLTLPASLLITLFDQSSSVFVRSAILDLAVDAEPVEATNIQDVREFPDRFLATVMAAAVERDGAQGFAPGERRGELERLERLPATTAAEATLVSLLQIAKPKTLSAASVLLRHKWKGEAELNVFFWTLANALDDETRREWLARVSAQGPKNGL